MTPIRIRIIFCIVALVMAASLFLRQHYIHRSLHAENAVLRQQTNLFSELEHVREDNRRLANLQTDAAELQRLRAEQTSLSSLEQEAAQLRRQLAERAAQKNDAATNATGSGWSVGQKLARADWKEAGQASATAAFQTYLSAIGEGNVERLKQCANIGVPPGYTNDFYSWAIKHRQGDWEKAQAVQLLAEARKSSQPDSAEIQVRFTFFKAAQPGTASEQKDGEKGEYGEYEHFSFVRTGEKWKLELETPPQTIEIVLSADPAERARQISELPPKYQEMVKAAPPSAKKLTIRQFGLPGPPPGAEGLRP
jgi:hypothetical protein